MEKNFVAVKLRLKRFGRRHRTCYRLNAIDGRTARDGKVIEELGFYDPEAKQPDQQLRIDRQRVEYWLSVGAQPSQTVANLLKHAGVALKS